MSTYFPVNLMALWFTQNPIGSGYALKQKMKSMISEKKMSEQDVKVIESNRVSAKNSRFYKVRA